MNGSIADDQSIGANGALPPHPIVNGSKNRHADQTRAQILYLSQGGGPLMILGDASRHAMADFMHRLFGRPRKPDAVLVTRAHWEEKAATVLGAPIPPLFYDY